MRMIIRFRTLLAITTLAGVALFIGLVALLLPYMKAGPQPEVQSSIMSQKSADNNKEKSNLPEEKHGRDPGGGGKDGP
jgi:hypothetical protein